MLLQAVFVMAWVPIGAGETCMVATSASTKKRVHPIYPHKEDDGGLDKGKQV